MNGAPLYQKLADEVQSLIEERSLRVGQRLPSVRVTARQRQISIGTAMQAYVVLENRGYIEARPKSGYYVRNLPPARARTNAGSVLGPGIAIAEKDLTEHLIDLALDPSYFPLGNAFPDPEILPLKSLSKVAGAVGRSEPGIFGRYSMGRSYEPFVQELSRRYLLTGVALSHDEFIVTSSCSEALHLALAAVTKRGDVIVVESPAYFGFLRLFASLGLKAVEVPVDPKKGLSLEALSVALDSNDVKAVVVTPSFHNPTGSCMPNARKEQLYSILRDYDIPAIEEDVYADLHYGPVRPKPLKAPVGHRRPHPYVLFAEQDSRSRCGPRMDLSRALSFQDRRRQVVEKHALCPEGCGKVHAGKLRPATARHESYIPKPGGGGQQGCADLFSEGNARDGAGGRLCPLGRISSWRRHPQAADRCPGGKNQHRSRTHFLGSPPV